MKVGFIGVGKLGKEAAEVMQSAGHEVTGYDVTEIKNTTIPMTNSLEEVCKDKELIFIAVPTPHHKDYDGSQPTSHLKPRDFDYSIVKSVLSKINEVIGLGINSNNIFFLIISFQCKKSFQDNPCFA